MAQTQLKNIHATNRIYFNNSTVFNSIENIDGNNLEIEIDSNTTIDFTGINLIDVTALRGSNGINNITGSSGADVINGNSGNDILNGGDGADTINGGNNNDTINGGLGADDLYGGAGTDIFDFDTLDAIDTIFDFDSVNETLDISDIIIGFTGTITDHINFVDSGANTLVQVDADGVGGYTTIAQINGITGLDEATLYGNGQIIV